ncbi:MAG: MFS transporter [Pyrobaculum sp.]
MSVQVSFRQVASVAAVAWSGAFLEWVDFYTYALLAVIVAKVFFPSADPIASLLASFAALAIGFLFRPLGAILFGKLGDQFGRKIAFIAAMILMLASTLGIGLLPGYAEIGILASIGVFILRIIQGLALGGGYGAAITYLGEFVPEHRRGFFTGFLFTTPAAGMATVGALIWLFSNILGTQAFNAWGWRLNFIVAGVIVFIIVLIMHMFYKETPVFSMLKAVRRVTSAPIREVFSRRYLPLVLMAWIGVVGAHGPIWYTNQLFNAYYIGPNFQNYVDAATASALLSTATYAALWMYPLFGYISDRIGRKPVLLLGIYGNALWFPIAFWLIDQVGPHKDLTALWLLFWSMTLFNGIGYSGAMSAFLLELFPARIRLSAVALAYNLGYGVTGGLTPFVIT